MLRFFGKAVPGMMLVPVLSCPAFAQSYTVCPGMVLSEISAFLVYTPDSKCPSEPPAPPGPAA